MKNLLDRVEWQHARVPPTQAKAVRCALTIPAAQAVEVAPQDLPQHRRRQCQRATQERPPEPESELVLADEAGAELARAPT